MFVRIQKKDNSQTTIECRTYGMVPTPHGVDATQNPSVCEYKIYIDGEETIVKSGETVFLMNNEGRTIESIKF